MHCGWEQSDDEKEVPCSRVPTFRQPEANRKNYSRDGSAEPHPHRTFSCEKPPRQYPEKERQQPTDDRNSGNCVAEARKCMPRGERHARPTGEYRKCDGTRP